METTSREHTPLELRAINEALNRVQGVIEFDIPAFVRNGDRLAPSFTIELLTVRNAVPGTGIAFADHTVTLNGAASSLVIPFDGDGNLSVNYARRNADAHGLPGDRFSESVRPL